MHLMCHRARTKWPAVDVHANATAFIELVSTVEVKHKNCDGTEMCKANQSHLLVSLTLTESCVKNVMQANINYTKNVGG